MTLFLSFQYRSRKNRLQWCLRQLRKQQHYPFRLLPFNLVYCRTPRWKHMPIVLAMSHPHPIKWKLSLHRFQSRCPSWRPLYLRQHLGIHPPVPSIGGIGKDIVQNSKWYPWKFSLPRKHRPCLPWRVRLQPVHQQQQQQPQQAPPLPPARLVGRRRKRPFFWVIPPDHQRLPANTIWPLIGSNGPILNRWQKRRIVSITWPTSIWMNLMRPVPARFHQSPTCQQLRLSPLHLQGNIFIQN